jgi:hypothetical protein
VSKSLSHRSTFVERLARGISNAGMTTRVLQIYSLGRWIARALAILLWPLGYVIGMGCRRAAVHQISEPRISHHHEDPFVVSGATVTELQAVANYWTATSILHSDGGVSIGLGVIALAVVGDVMSPGPMKTLALATGVFLVASGAWLRARPQPFGFVVDGAGTILVGFWMIVMSVQPGNSPVLLIYGIGQIIVGVEKTVRYPVLARVWSAKPSAESFGRLEALLQQLDAEPEHIEFTVTSYPQSITWKADLRPKVGIFASTDRDVAFGQRGEVEILRAHKKFMRTEIGARVRIGSRTLSGTFEEEAFRRLRNWVSAVAG